MCNQNYMPQPSYNPYERMQQPYANNEMHARAEDQTLGFSPPDAAGYYYAPSAPVVYY